MTGSVLDILCDLQLSLIIKHTLLWAVGGVVLGTGIGLLSNRISRPGDLSSESKVVRVFRIITFVIVTVICAGIGGCSGAMEGGLRGTEKVLKEGVIGCELLTRTAGYCADVFQVVTIYGDKLDKLCMADTSGGYSCQEDILRFRKEDGLFDSKVFCEHAEKLTGPMVHQIRDRIRVLILSEEPDWKGKDGEKILDYGLGWVTRSLASVGPGKEAGLAAGQIREFANGLRTNLLQECHADKVKRSELSRMIVGKYFVPVLLRPLKQSVTASHMSSLVFILLLTGIPIVCFKIIGARQASRN